MQLVAYRGFNRLGRKVSGTLIERDVAAAKRYLVSIDIVPSSCALSSLKLSILHRSRSKSIKRESLQLFFSDLAKLLEAQLTIDVALQNILQTSPQSDIAILASTLLERLGFGESLAEALRSADNSIDAGTIQIIAVGERVGDVGMSFRQVSDSLAWRIDFAKRLRSAIAYPALVGSLLVLVMVFLVTTVVPSLSGFLGTVGQELSWHTRQLLVLSDFLYNWGFRFMLAIALTAAILYFICRFSERSALLRDRLFLQLPLFGELIRKISLARFTQGLSDLLSSRLNLYDALLSSSRLVSNRYLSDSIGLLPVTVQEGLKLSDAMRASGVFDSAAIQAVSVGEHSGDLPTSILEVSALYTNDASAYLQRLQRLIGPVMMSFVGFFIIWIVLSVVAPIYQAAIGAGALL